MNDRTTKEEGIAVKIENGYYSWGVVHKQNNNSNNSCNSSYDELLEACKDKVYALVLLGQTAQKIYDCAKNKGFNNVNIVKDMKEAVQLSHKLAKDGEVVLLSPACASWDMYKSFEVRGNDFKENVNNLK